MRIQFCKRLSDENETQETKVEVLELTLVVIADSKTCQRDFMRRNGLGILSEMYSSAQTGDVLMEEVGNMQERQDSFQEWEDMLVVKQLRRYKTYESVVNW